MGFVGFWLAGFAIFWAGLRLFDDEVLLITAVAVGAALVVWGLALAPLGLQLAVEIACVVVVFFTCMRCIERGQ